MFRLPNATRLRAHLKRGGLIAYPTEYCYGLGCYPHHAKALQTLLHLKKRPQHKGLIVIGARLPQFSSLLQHLPQSQQQYLEQTWPAAKTFILPARHIVLPTLRGKGRTQLAVRVPAHEPARQLCRQAGSPLVSTSCNRAKNRPCKTERQARRLFGKQVWVIGGLVGKRKRPSELIDLSQNKVLR